MRSAVAEYLNNYNSFELFGLSHWTAILIFIFLLIFLPFYSKSHLSINQQKSLGNILGFLIFINFPIWVLLEFIGGSFDVKLHLPLHLCRFANLLLPFVMLRRNEFLFQILFYWGLSGMFQAIITPDIVQDFPHFHYFRFFIGHHLMIVALMYIIIVYKMKPTIEGLKNSFFGLNLFLVIAFLANILLDANYFWIMEKPPTGSLLDYMGPWPWYILTAEFLALAHFALAYFIFILLKKYLIK
jgi:hypothetical integral membrane protein (TIGR02206 family)|tara:strand:+ start:199 stop:924 length:726 start_codon:yes stop_codon:yes gene_type:complete